jgi:hypothetical protein
MRRSSTAGPGTWDRVQTILVENRRTRANRTRAQTPALLRGLIFAPTGHAMTPSHARKNGRLYRYYVSTEAIKSGYGECPVRSIPAGDVEEVVLAQVRALLRSPEIIAQTWAAVRRENEISEREVVEALGEFEPLWDELFPAEQARIVRLLVERVDVSPKGIDVRLRAEGLRALTEELRLKEAA